jgi:hypothetical protein
MKVLSPTWWLPRETSRDVMDEEAARNENLLLLLLIVETRRDWRTFLQ